MNFKYYFSSVLMFFFLILFFSCTPRIGKIATEPITYPIAPDTAKIQYLTSFRGSADVSKKQSGLQKAVFGERKEQPIYKPYGVFIRNGKIYVSDIALGGGLDIIDLENKEFKYFVPEGVYDLQLVLNSFVDINDQMYIVDATLHKVIVYNALGNYVTSFGKDENIKPTAVYGYENKIYVVDSKNNRINIYNKNTYQFVDYFPKSKIGEDGFLYKPTNITVEKDKVYVSDIGNGVVNVYTLGGEYIKKVGQFGNNIGSFVRPKGIAVDRDENLYVIDAAFENSQVFNKNGQLLMFFGGHYTGPGGMWLPTGICIDYDNLKYFERYVDPKYKLEYIIIVANQFGPDKISVYGRIEMADEFQDKDRSDKN